jgi:hypothetical protein
MQDGSPQTPVTPTSIQSAHAIHPSNIDRSMFVIKGIHSV